MWSAIKEGSIINSLLLLIWEISFVLFLISVILWKYFVFLSPSTCQLTPAFSCHKRFCFFRATSNWTWTTFARLKRVSERSDIWIWCCIWFKCVSILSTHSWTFPKTFVFQIFNLAFRYFNFVLKICIGHPTTFSCQQFSIKDLQSLWRVHILRNLKLGGKSPSLL